MIFSSLQKSHDSTYTIYPKFGLAFLKICLRPLSPSPFLLSSHFVAFLFEFSSPRSQKNSSSWYTNPPANSFSICTRNSGCASEWIMKCRIAAAPGKQAGTRDRYGAPIHIPDVFEYAPIPTDKKRNTLGIIAVLHLQNRIRRISFKRIPKPLMYPCLMSLI